MKTTYIYLNTYENGYLYVGSHTWDGPAGQLDPTYHGTSHIAMQYGWNPIEEKILEEVPEERKYVAEKEWIEKYCTLFGIAECAVRKAKSSWPLKFKQNGRMLNLHSNYASQIITPEVRNKGLQTRIANGFYVRINNSEEVRAKVVATRRANGAIERWSEAAHTKEAMYKRGLTRKLSGRRIRVGNIEGSIKDVADKVGLDWANIHRHIRKGETKFTIKDKTIEVC